MLGEEPNVIKFNGSESIRISLNVETRLKIIGNHGTYDRTFTPGDWDVWECLDTHLGWHLERIRVR